MPDDLASGFHPNAGFQASVHRLCRRQHPARANRFGAILAVVLAKLFMAAYPVLRIDQFCSPNAEGSQNGSPR